MYLDYLNLTIKVATSGQSWHCKHFCKVWSSPPSSFPSRNANKYKILFEIWWKCSRFPDFKKINKNYTSCFIQSFIMKTVSSIRLKCLTPVRSNNLFAVFSENYIYKVHFIFIVCHAASTVLSGFVSCCPTASLVFTGPSHNISLTW